MARGLVLDWAFCSQYGPLCQQHFSYSGVSCVCQVDSLVKQVNGLQAELVRLTSTERDLRVEIEAQRRTAMLNEEREADRKRRELDLAAQVLGSPHPPIC